MILDTSTLSRGPVNRFWEHVNMSLELGNMYRESHTVSIEPICMSRYTFGMSNEHWQCLGDLLTCLKSMLSCVGSLLTSLVSLLTYLEILLALN
jgi:hypothetical protein